MSHSSRIDSAAILLIILSQMACGQSGQRKDVAQRTLDAPSSRQPDSLSTNADVWHGIDQSGGTDSVPHRGELAGGDLRQSVDGSDDASNDTVCVPDCEDRQCGTDGCGGSCGDCEMIDCMKATCIEETGICKYNGNSCCCQYDEHCLNSDPCTHDYCDGETQCCVHEWVCR